MNCAIFRFFQAPKCFFFLSSWWPKQVIVCNSKPNWTTNQLQQIFLFLTDLLGTNTLLIENTSYFISSGKLALNDHISFAINGLKMSVLILEESIFAAKSLFQREDCCQDLVQSIQCTILVEMSPKNIIFGQVSRIPPFQQVHFGFKNSHYFMTSYLHVKLILFWVKQWLLL